MHVKTRNVNTAFQEIVSGIHAGEISAIVSSGESDEILQVGEPIVLTYSHPRERVLFNTARDCNPFLYLFEALWMLAGRNDVEPLAYYDDQISDVISDDGETFNGAYGYRWRSSRPKRFDNDGPDEDTFLEHSTDQLKVIISHLKSKPGSYRAVLQMWNVEDDLLKIDESKNICCNTHVYFLVEMGSCLVCKGSGYETTKFEDNDGIGETSGPCRACGGFPHDVPCYLNMTVCSSSSDLILGTLGTNAVCFSILQEYLAACIGLEVGTYTHFLNNLYTYTETWEPDKWLAGYKNRSMHDPQLLSYDWDVKTVVPLVRDPRTFDRECAEFIDNKDWSRNWREPFLQRVAAPMTWAFQLHKLRSYGMALKAIASVESDDWRLAGRDWIEKRRLDWEDKKSAEYAEAYEKSDP